MKSIDNTFPKSLGVLFSLICVFSIANAQHQKRIPLTFQSVDTLFTAVSDSLGHLAEGTIAWGDYDNDGALDLFVNGHTTVSATNNYSLIFHNNSGRFVQINDSLVGVHGNSGCARWVDYNNDGKLDLYIEGSQGPANNNAVAKIYRNNGNGMFADISASILGLAGTSACGDYDNDNNIDLLVTGSPNNGGSILSKIYRNDGNGNFTDIRAALVGVWGASVAWGDYDNDGPQDIVVTGLVDIEETGATKIYHNNGNGTFTDIHANIVPVWFGSVAWGDYDNDGRLDIIITGIESDVYPQLPVTKIYHNDGNGVFTDILAPITNLSMGAVAWGDYDNDGYLDFAITGSPDNGQTYVTKIYHNDGQGHFVDAGVNNIPGVSYASLAWGDYDNDGYLDLAISGSNDTGFVTKIFHNNLGTNPLTNNTPPTAPEGLVTTVNGKSVQFQWAPANDLETPQKGLTYNLRIGKTPGGVDIMSPMSDVQTGFRKIPAMGNVDENTSWTINNLPKGMYYWSVQAVDNEFAGSPFGSERTFYTSGGASISGSVFNDSNADSVREIGEPGLANWRVDISGKRQKSVYTDSNGLYSFGSLDSGTYIVTQQPQAVWKQTFPSSVSYVLTIGVNDSITGIDFGDAYPWNTIEGTAYFDVNENGMKDVFEPGLLRWTVTLFGEDSVVFIRTDSLGHYRFPHVAPGLNTVELTVQPSYEQETPRYQQGYTYDIQTIGDQYTGFDFGVHKIPIRVKIPLTIYDNTLVNRRDIWFGIRPGATYGIWGVDPKATNVDFSESEFEIPPPTFGLFDARFQDPQGGTSHFGAGSWTDMRDFFSTTQRDTFLVTFAPGYYFNGNYPMTIQWSRQDIHSAFPTVDPVLIDPKGNRIDMWNGSGDTTKVVISDSTISSLSIVTVAPNITFSRRWNMVSLPQNIFDDYVHNLFTTANSHAFAYAPGTGYTIQDTLHSGKGYWVNYSSAVDSLKINPPSRLFDSITLQPGWNMIGTLSAPVSINQITTHPSGIYSSRFFGYDRGYSVTDTLLPAKGYWIKASQSAKMFLNASVTVPKTAIENNLLTASSILLFQDNAGNREQLYCRTVQAGDTNDLYEAPPLPPDGQFDVRFSSNRILETIGTQQTGKFPIAIHGAEFPVTLSWQGNANSIKASIVIDRNETFLNGKTTIRIANPSSSIVLNLLGMPAIPSAFALEQNYPNPFNPTTKFSYSVPKTSQVSIKIYDVLGRELVTLVNEKKDPGEYSLTWTAASIPSGVYFYRMTSGNFVQTKKMVLLK